MTKTSKKSGTAAVLALLCVFIISAFTTLALGVGTYRNITEASRQGLDERLLFSYVWTKAKMGDEAGNVYVGEFGGLTALFIDEESGGGIDRTAIYHYDGWVYELFFEAGQNHLPRDGAPVGRSGSFLVEQLDNGLIKISAGPESAFLCPKSREALTMREGEAVQT